MSSETVKRLYFFLLPALAITVWTIGMLTPHVFALDCTDTDLLKCKNDTNPNNCIDDVIKVCEQNLATSKGQKETLVSTISYLNTRIRLTETQIAKTQLEITTLIKDIDALKTRIDGLELSLERLTEVLISRIQDAYKHRAKINDPVLLLFSARGLNDFFTQLKYIRLSQNYTQNLIQEAESQKVAFDNQKKLKEEKQAEVEKLKKKLESQRMSLQDQQKQKQAVLAATKNDESKFQSLLQQALLEQRAIEAALVSGVKVGPVKKGDPIALVGNSGYPGCSTGEHLHFEVRKNNVWVDPANYLSSKTMTDEEKGGNATLGSGSWSWPIQDTIRLTQHFGHTPYSWRYKYSGGIHTGYDIVSTSSKVIRAPADGTLFSSSQSCGSSTMNVKYIEHGDGVISLYLHVQ